jgi:superfamily II RNA helicase
MIATGTVAAGVDFPARTVVVTAHSKRGSEGFDVLTSSEFQQMAGRAGRRGKDAVGLCVIAPSRFSDARVFHQVAQRPPEPLRSAYYAAPATMLNLLKYRTVDDLRFMVAKSLAAYLDRKGAHGIREGAVAEEFAAESNSNLHGEAKKKALKRARRKIKEADELEQRQEVLLNASLEGLEKLGYVSGGTLTSKGGWAANLCTSLVLELAEAISDGLFDDLTVEELAGLVAAIAGDPHRPYFSLKANPLKKEYFQKLEAILARVRESYRPPGSSGEAKVLPDAALTVLTWMASPDWLSFSGLLRLNGIAEGDVARLVSQTADHLNQISRLHESHPVLAAAAEEARARLLRPPLTETIAAV